MKDETTPSAFLNIARNYCEASNVLLSDNSTNGKNQLQLNPIYMLYFHATEVALKAFLRHKGFKTKELKKIGHKLAHLYDKCVESGFITSKKFAVTLRNITGLLDSGNDESAFRYESSKSLKTASIDYVNAAVNKLIESVETYFPMNPTNKKLGIASKVNVHIGVYQLPNTKSLSKVE